MTAINGLRGTDTISPGDLVAVYSTTNGGPRKAPASAFVDAIGQSYVDQAEAQADAATASVSAFQNLVYPGVYAVDPTTRPNGSAMQDGDRAVVLVGGVPTEKLRVLGAWIVPNVDAVNLAAPSGSSLVGFLQEGAGAVARTVQSKARGLAVSPEDFGATGVSAATDTAAFTAALGAVPDGGVITLEVGKTYQLNSVNVTGKRITIIGYGSTINCNGASNGAIFKTDHGKRLTIVGVRFTGTGKAINYVTAPSGSQFDDFEISFCRFENTDYGIYLDGSREGRIISCSFEGVSNGGIYRVRSVNTDVISCYWKNTTFGVNDEGDGTAFSAGLKIIGGTMIGCGTGVYSQRSDYVVLNGVMIDYCDNPVVFRGVDIALIGGGCYITTRTTAPAILIDEHVASATTCREIRVIGNAIASNIDDVTSDTVRINKLASGEVSSNSITFWWRSGIDFSACTNLKITYNKINPDPGSTAPTKTSVLESATGSNSNVISDNEVAQTITTISAEVARNSGFVTQNRSESASGTGVTSFTIAHGLAYTPSKSDVILTPTNNEAATKNPFVSAVDATNITVGFTAATASAAGVGWTVKRGGTRV